MTPGACSSVPQMGQIGLYSRMFHQQSGFLEHSGSSGMSACVSARLTGIGPWNLRAACVCGCMCTSEKVTTRMPGSDEHVVTHQGYQPSGGSRMWSRPWSFGSIPRRFAFTFCGTKLCFFLCVLFLLLSVASWIISCSAACMEKSFHLCTAIWTRAFTQTIFDSIRSTYTCHVTFLLIEIPGRLQWGLIFSLPVHKNCIFKHVSIRVIFMFV